MKHSIACVINFCSNDWRFLERSIESVRSFSTQILISVGDHFFNGEPENYGLLEYFYARLPTCQFLEFIYDNDTPYGRAAPLAEEDHDRVHHWHNTGRLVPFYFLKPEIEVVLFLDVDEIIDTRRFVQWLDGFDYRAYSGLRLSSYWYFREAHYRANEHTDISLMVQKKALCPEMILDPDERMGLYCQLPEEKKRDVTGLDGLPMVHHFSWTRTQAEMLKKTQTWGHHWERDWKGLIEKEFSEGFSGKDFARGFTYEKVEPYFDPLALKLPRLPLFSFEEHIQNLRQWPHVKRVQPQEIFRLEINRYVDCCDR